MKLKIYILFFYLSSSLFSLNFAQTIVNGRFIVIANNGINYSVKIQINTDSENNYLGSSNLRFFFSGDISYPLNPTPGVDYTFHNFNGGNYNTGEIVRPSEDQISVNIDLNNPNIGTLIDQSPGWTDVVTINFSTEDPGVYANLDWNLPATVIFSDNESTIWNEGDFIGINTTPLPVELTSFTANLVNGKILVSWITATETNNSGFILERSNDDLKFVELAFIEGNGTTTNRSEYSYKDNSVLSGKYYYRLKQVDFDGSFYYLKIIEAYLGLPNEYSLDQNYPNPFNPSTTIRFGLPTNSEVNIKLYNSLGQEAADILKNELDAGIHEVIFNVNSLSSGVYFYRIEAKGIDGSVFSEVKRMILIK